MIESLTLMDGKKSRLWPFLSWISLESRLLMTSITYYYNSPNMILAQLIKDRCCHTNVTASVGGQCEASGRVKATFLSVDCHKKPERKTSS